MLPVGLWGGFSGQVHSHEYSHWKDAKSVQRHIALSINGVEGKGET